MTPTRRSPGATAQPDADPATLAPRARGLLAELAKAMHLWPNTSERQLAHVARTCDAQASAVAMSSCPLLAHDALIDVMLDAIDLATSQRAQLGETAEDGTILAELTKKFRYRVTDKAAALKSPRTPRPGSRFAAPIVDDKAFGAFEIEQMAKVDREIAERCAEEAKARERSERVGGVASAAALFDLAAPSFATLARDRSPDRGEARPGLRSGGSEALTGASTGAKRVAGGDAE